MEQRELTDAELLRVYFGHFRMRRAVRMFGWCVLWGALGYRRWSQVEAAPPPGLIGEVTWYEALREWREFRAKVAEAEGRPPDQVDEGDLARRVVEAAQREKGATLFRSVGVS